MPCFTLGRKGWPFCSPASVSQSKVKARQGTGYRTSMYIHVHPCTSMYSGYPAIYTCIRTGLHLPASTSFSVNEISHEVLGTAGCTVCTYVSTCTCMYVCTTIPYIPISNETAEDVNRALVESIFWPSGSWPAGSWPSSLSGVHSLASRPCSAALMMDYLSGSWCCAISRPRRDSWQKQENCFRWFIKLSEETSRDTGQILINKNTFL